MPGSFSRGGIKPGPRVKKPPLSIRVIVGSVQDECARRWGESRILKKTSKFDEKPARNRNPQGASGSLRGPPRTSEAPEHPREPSRTLEHPSDNPRKPPKAPKTSRKARATRFARPKWGRKPWGRCLTANVVQHRQRPLLGRRRVVSNYQRPRQRRQRVPFKMDRNRCWSSYPFRQGSTSTVFFVLFPCCFSSCSAWSSAIFRPQNIKYCCATPNGLLKMIGDGS